LAPLLLAAGVFVFLIAQYAVFVTISGSTTPYFEEPIGYRHFYSLRIIYGGETPWIPQGHTAGIVHHLLQMLLTAVGYPTADLSARLDTFVTVNVVAWLLAVAAALYVVCRTIANTPLSVAVCSLLVLFANATDAHSIWHLHPDYHVVILLMAVVTLAWLARILLVRDARLCSWASAFALGAFAGLCVGNKITNVVYPLTIGLFYLYVDRRNFQKVASSAVIGVAVLCIVVTIYYAGNPKGIWIFLVGLKSFVRAQTLSDAGAHAFLQFAYGLRPRGSLDLAWLGVVLIPLALAAGATRRFRPVLLLAPGLAFIVYFLFRRNYSWSALEVHLYVWLSICIFLIVAFHPMYTKSHPAARSWAICGLSLIMVLAAGAISFPRIASLAAWNGEFYAGYRTFLATIEKRGKVLNLTPENNYRMMSTLSSLCKGGTDIFEPVWGTSPYMQRLFPDYSCAVIPKNVSLAGAQVIIFRRLEPDDLRQGIARVENYFKVSLDGFDCRVRAPVPLGDFVACFRK
jgi:hypothetical protein